MDWLYALIERFATTLFKLLVSILQLGIIMPGCSYVLHR